MSSAFQGGGRGRGGARPLSEEEKTDGSKVTWPLLKRIFSYLLPYWPRFLLVFLCILVSSWLSILPSVLMGRIVDEGFIGGNLDILIKLIGVSFGVLILSNLIGVFEAWLNVWIAQHITFDMRNKMFRHLLNMSCRFFTTNRQGEAITRMTTDIGGVQTVISGTLTGLISNITLLTLAVITMYQKNWILATAGILIIPFLILPTRRVGQKRWDITSQAQAKNDEINQILSETMSVSGQMLVKLFNREETEYRKYESVNEDMTGLNIKESMAGRWFRATIGILTNAGPMVIYLAGGLLMLRFGVTDLTVGDVTVMVALLDRLYRPVNSLLNMQVEIVRSMAIFTRIFQYYDIPLEIENKPDAIKPDTLEGSLEFKDVSFHYNEGSPILHNVSFTVGKGRSVAIVGPSGAGKSTIINLIPRLYDVVEGQVLLDGHDVRDLDLDWLRSNIGLVTQDTYLFNDTIRSNLLYAAPEASDADLIKACKEAHIHDFIASLPQGYNTEVGNRGVKLSGGERQRMSIARVILKDPGMVVLDEATSSLDSISENLIQNAIEPLLKGKTSLVIAHRLSTIMACDEILVLKGGVLVERGTHGDLLKFGGVYRELYETQFRLGDKHL
ncbi:MAG: ABC transporter ATP-binding protein/permease [Treponema sp.]|jgi:ATP-binding cassette subfamily B protein|nr:ABC transporter ATP-binding protein/permease [Treponema sp.]